MKKETDLDRLLNLVSEVSGCSVEEMESDRRLDAVVTFRHCFFYLARKYTHRSQGEIGERVGGRAASTALLGAQSFRDRLETGMEPKLVDAVAAMERCIQGANPVMAEVALAGELAELERETERQIANLALFSSKEWSIFQKNCSSLTPFLESLRDISRRFRGVSRVEGLEGMA